jgi:pSer/pThr/pTyr-binding forkhead associated (FHA) protein
VPSLLMKEGPLAGERFEIDRELVLGRTNADITIQDPLISRRHAVVRAVDSAIEIEDLGSLNGTIVNDERIQSPRRLEHGDVIALGSSLIEVENEPVAPRTVLAPASPVKHDTVPSIEPPVDAPAPAPVEAPAPPPVEAPAPVPVEAPAPVPVEAAAPPPPVEAQAPEAPLAPPRQGAEGDEVRPVTALFADIVGSTSLGEQLSSDQVKIVIGECVTRMCNAVEQFGGEVQSYMGDGIAAFFGVPAAHEDDPERAARAALRLLEVIRH